MSDTETNITGDVHGDAYTGNIGQIGDRHISTGGGIYIEGDQIIHHHYGPAAPSDRAPHSTALDQAERDAIQTDVGLTALASLLHAPQVRTAVIAFQTDLEATSQQIELLASLKELHDNLHNIEYQCFRLIQQEEPRFLTDELAAENLADNQLTLQDLLQRVQTVSQRPVLQGEDISWTTDLVEAESLLREAVSQRQTTALRRCIQLLKRLLTREPSRINERLNRTAGMLRLEQIETALFNVSEWLNTAELHLDPEAISRFSQGVKALGRLRTTLVQAVDNHSRWQALDVELRRVDAVLVYDLEDLVFTWPDVRRLSQSLCEEITAGWVLTLKREEAQLDQALYADNPAQVRRHFFRFRRQVGLRFYQVDTELRELCGELSRVAIPLDTILRLLG